MSKEVLPPKEMARLLKKVDEVGDIYWVYVDYLFTNYGEGDICCL